MQVSCLWMINFKKRLRKIGKRYSAGKTSSYSEPADQDAILTNEYEDYSDVHPLIFYSINALAIKQAALHVNGAAGPSGTDAQAWKHFVTSFGMASDDLCSSLACAEMNN